MQMGNKVLDEKISQFKKAVEIVGGKDLLKGRSDQELFDYIIDKVFNEEAVKFNINNKDYTIKELIKEKQCYEKNFLRNKSTTLNSIIYKIKKYDTSLDSIIRKYKKTRGLEEYNKIYSGIIKTYRLDINKIVLSSINSDVMENLGLEEQESYYIDYLNQKRKQIVDGVISKMGIV